MNLLAHLLIVLTFDLTFRGECRFVYVNRNLTFVAAWTRCHDIYKGQLADLERLFYFSQRLRSPCGKTNDFFWHGSLTKTLPWISFEGCFQFFNYSKAITMPYISLAWCQNHCLLYNPNRSHFAIGSNLCLCDIYSLYGQSKESKQCNIPCDDSAICGGNGFISLYKRAPLPTHHVSDFDSPENIDKRCLAFKCVSENVTNEAANCVDQLPYICVNRTGQFHSPRKEPWLTSNILCTNMLEAPVCRNVTISGELRRWTKILRVQYQFKDHVSTTMEEVQIFLNSSFYTNDREGRRVLMPDGRKEYPSICDTEEELIDEDWICDITSGTEIRQVSSPESSMETTSYMINEVTHSGLNNTTDQSYVHDELTSFGYEFSVMVGVHLVVLITVVGLVMMYRRVKNTRQQGDLVNVEVEVGREDGGNISSRPTEGDITPVHSNANAQDDVHRSSTRNLSVYSFARTTDVDILHCNVEDSLFVYSKARNESKSHHDVSMDDVDTIYNDIEDSSTAEIEISDLSTAIYVDDGVYTEIVPEQSQNEPFDDELSVYGDVPDGVYDILNDSNRRRKQNGMMNVTKYINRNKHNATMYI